MLRLVSTRIMRVPVARSILTGRTFLSPRAPLPSKKILRLFDIRTFSTNGGGPDPKQQRPGMGRAALVTVRTFSSNGGGPDPKQQRPGMGRAALVTVRTFSSNGGGPDPKQQRPGMGHAALVTGLFAALTGKAKFIFTGLKLFKFTPVLSMIGTSITYSFFFGWPYSVGMVSLIFVHEAGHALALRYYGQPFSPFVMVPFMGAVIVSGPPKNAWQDSVVGE